MEFLKLKRNGLIVHGLVVCLALLSGAEVVCASEDEHRLSPGVALALGIGAEVTYGNYGNNAEATVVTMPLLVALNPLPELDMTLELPLAYLSSRSASGIVVTQSGGTGFRRGTPRNGSMNTSASGITTMTTTDGGTSSAAGLGDISLTAGYAIVQDSEQTPRIRPMVYLKAPSGDKNNGLGTGTFEGGAGLSLSKWLGNVQLFGDASYILQNSTNDYQGRNYASYSAGAGVQATDRLFVSLYAKGSSARITGGTAPLEGRLKLNFLQSRRVVWELYGLAGFTDASPAVGGGFMAMYQF